MINAAISFSGHALNKNDQRDSNMTGTCRNAVPQYTGGVGDARNPQATVKSQPYY